MCIRDRYILREKIRKKAKALGVDLVGFLNVNDYSSPRSPDPKHFLRSARSIITLAFRAIAGEHTSPKPWSWMPSFFYCPETLAQTTCYQLARFLENTYKARSFIVQAHRPFEFTEESFRAPVGTVSLRHSAVQSGLAVFGKNTLALTKEYGPRVLFMGLLTSMDIESDSPMTDYDPCSSCSYPCWENCPGKAFTEDRRVLSHRCTKHSQPYDLGNLMRFLIEMAGKSTMDERLAMLKGPRFFNHMQYLQGYIYYQCWECTKACPPSTT